MYGTTGGAGAMAGTGAGYVIFGHQITLGLALVVVALLIVLGAVAYRRANRGKRYVA